MTAPNNTILHSLEETTKGSDTPNKNSEEKLYSCVCRSACSMGCRLYAHVRQGRVVKVSKAPFPDPDYGGICLRGLSHLQRMYHRDRLKYPLRRVGKRGEDKWERITWDKAIDEIVKKFSELQEKHGTQSIAFLPMGGNQGILNKGYIRLANLLRATILDGASDCGLFWATGHVFSGNYSDITGTGSELVDLVSARTIINWATNLTETRPMVWRFVARAMEENGAKFIVIDPRFTPTASKADQWLSIRNATDGALALGMIKVILDEGLQDDEFLRNKTVAPFLVREDNGLHLRLSHITGDEISEGQDDPYLVWDSQAGEARPVNEVAAPALQGSYIANGIKANTALDLLKEAVAEYTLDHVSEITDLAPETIHELAITCATQKPVSIFFGPTLDHYGNGHKAYHAIFTLATVTGNIGKPGASCGDFYPSNWAVNVFSFLLPDPQRHVCGQIDVITLKHVLETGEHFGQPYPVKALFVHQSNVASNRMNQREWIEEVLPKLDMVVVADFQMTDTARYADIVLPACYWFEYEEVVPTAFHPCIMMQEQAVQPLYESKSDLDIARLLAQGFSLGGFFDKSNEEFFDSLLRGPQPEMYGITPERLRQEKVIRYLPKPFIRWAEGCTNPTGRVRFYVENPQPRMYYASGWFNAEEERLPAYKPPKEIHNQEQRKKYPLIFMQSHERWRVHSQWFEVPWMRELETAPFLQIHPDDARARQINNEDDVRVFNDRGHVVVKARVTKGVKPGVVCLPKGWQRHQYKAGGYQELTMSYVDPVSQTQPFFDSLVDVEKWEG